MNKPQTRAKRKFYRGYSADEIVEAFERNGFTISRTTVYAWISGSRQPGSMSRKLFERFCPAKKGDCE